MFIRRIIVAITCTILLLSGCVTISVPTSHGPATYKRWFTDQSIKGFTATADVNGTLTVKFESQESQAEAVVILAGQVAALSKLVITK